MQTLTEFYRSVYVPTRLKKRESTTLIQYKATINLVTEILGNLPLDQYDLLQSAFTAEMKGRNAADATIDKHIRHINAVFKHAKVAIWNRHDVPEKQPKIVFDNEFQALYRAFGNENQFPKYLAAKNRPHFWRTIMEFVAVTALRREAVLSLEWCNVNTKERFLTVEEWQDKKKRRRFKPLTDDLIAKLHKLQGFGTVTGPKRHCLFPWVHGDKKWYECWNSAKNAAGVTVGLHDLKRFSGELALRCGATELELM